MAVEDGLADEGRGIIIAPMEYICRVCGTGHTVHVSVDMKDGEPTIDLSRVRLTTQRCGECREDRAHVAAEALDASVRVETDE